MTQTKKGRVLSVRLPNSILLGAFDLCDSCDADPGTSMSTAVVRALTLVVSSMQQDGKLPVYDSEEQAGQLLALRGFAGRTWDGPNRPAQAEPKFSTERAKGRMSAYAPTYQNLPKAAKAVKRLFVPETAPPTTSSDFAPSLYNPDDFGELDPTFAVDLDVSLENFKENGESDSDVGLSADARFHQLIEQDVSELIEAERQDLLSKIMVRQHKERGEQTEDQLVQTVHTTSVKFVAVDDPRLADDVFYSKAVDETRRRALRLVYAALPHADWSTETAQRLVEQTILTLAKENGK